MSASQAHLVHKPGHVRAPGPKPTPTRRRTTLPEEQPQGSVSDVVVSSASPSSAPEVQKKPRRKCGSKKPRNIVTKALLILAMEQGLEDLKAQREEELNAESSEEVRKQAVIQDLALLEEKPEPKEEVYGNFTFTVDPLTGKETMVDVHIAPRKAVSSQEKKKEVNRSKLYAILAEKCNFQAKINLGKLIEAALENPRIVKNLDEVSIPVPSKASSPPRKKSVARTSGFQAMKENTRSGLKTSHRGFSSSGKGAKSIH